MGKIHEHMWAESERMVARPPQRWTLENYKGDARTLERLTYGVTTIVLTCSLCGDKKTQEILGGVVCGDRP